MMGRNAFGDFASCRPFRYGVAIISNVLSFIKVLSLLGSMKLSAASSVDIFRTV
jgi:hypothetical protein